MLCGWEDNLASGVAPATRYRLRSLWKGESTIPTGARNFCLGVQKFRGLGLGRRGTPIILTKSLHDYHKCHRLTLGRGADSMTLIMAPLPFWFPTSRRAEVGSGEVKAEGREEVW